MMETEIEEAPWKSICLVLFLLLLLATLWIGCVCIEYKKMRARVLYLGRRLRGDPSPLAPSVEQGITAKELAEAEKKEHQKMMKLSKEHGPALIGGPGSQAYNHHRKRISKQRIPYWYKVKPYGGGLSSECNGSEDDCSLCTSRSTSSSSDKDEIKIQTFVCIHPPNPMEKNKVFDSPSQGFNEGIGMLNVDPSPTPTMERAKPAVNYNSDDSDDFPPQPRFQSCVAEVHREDVSPASTKKMMEKHFLMSTPTRLDKDRKPGEFIPLSTFQMTMSDSKDGAVLETMV